jgi:hypothetical protein
MWLGDVPVALASERMTTAFCLRAAARVQRTSLDQRILFTERPVLRSPALPCGPRVGAAAG